MAYPLGKTPSEIFGGRTGLRPRVAGLPLVIPFLHPHISMAMNPYEIIKDAVLKTEGMSVKAFVILVLGMTLVFTLLL